MVRAIISGKKTQTRRVIKPQPIYFAHGGQLAFADKHSHPHFDHKRGIKQPYEVGDLLWVREAWASSKQAVGPEEACYVYRATDPDWSEFQGWRWKPSIFMPKKASRLHLMVTGVRVERLHSISEEDAKAEGVDPDAVIPFFMSHKETFMILWDDINKKRGYGWDTNPWVWVVDFELMIQEA